VVSTVAAVRSLLPNRIPDTAREIRELDAAPALPTPFFNLLQSQLLRTLLNPDASLPVLPIKVVYRPVGKGTNYVFTEFLSKTSSKFRTEVGTSPSPKWPVGVPTERSSDMAE
jgi:hypothetical protein